MAGDRPSPVPCPRSVRDAEKAPEPAPEAPGQADPNAVRELYVEFKG